MGLLTSLKNFFQLKKWKKSTTNQSQQSTQQLSSLNPEFTEEEVTQMLADLRRDLDAYKNSINKFKEEVEDITESFKNNISTTMDMVDTFEPTAPVFITRKMDSILDFINSCDPLTKDRVLDALKSSSADKALFLTAVKDDEKTYVILMNITSLPEEEGLALAYSTDLDTLSYFLAELTTLSEDDVKNEFKDGKEE
jgi:hypothetical protein